MSEVYIPLEDAAELEGIDYEAMKKRVQRNLDRYKTKPASRHNGKPRTLIAVSTLSQNARQVYLESQSVIGLDKLAGQPFDDSDPPWYVSYDPIEYRNKYDTSYQAGATARQVIEEYLEANETGNSKFKKEFLERHSLSARTFDRNLSDYRTASAWALYMERKKGASHDYFKTLALCRKPKEKTAFRSYEVEVDGIPLDLRVVIHQLWFDTDKGTAPNRKSVAKLQRDLRKRCAVNGITEIPSIKTLYRYIDYLNEYCNGRDVKYFLANGELAFKQNRQVRARRDLKSLDVMQILVADAHTFDLWVEYTYPNGTKTAIRPVLVAWMEMKSRMIFGDVICEHPNANTVAQSFYKAIYTAGSTAQRLLLDNGKEFTSERLVGQLRKFRLDISDDDVGVYKGAGVKHVTRALPYMPHIKAEIERFFGTVAGDFSKEFASYTGTLTGSRTDAKVKKNIKNMLERGELYTMEEFMVLWSRWLEEYHCRLHQGLVEQKEEFHTPIEVFSNCTNVGSTLPPKEYAIQLAMQTKGVVVQQNGIRLNNLQYTAAELSNYKGQAVNAYWDPDDVTRLYVYRQNNEFLCMAYEQQLLGMYDRVPQQALLDYWKMQKAQLSNVKASAEQLLDLGEYIDAYDTFSKKVHGTLDLIKRKSPKIVALPQDKRFKQLAAQTKSSGKAKPNSYLVGEGRKVLEELEKLG